MDFLSHPARMTILSHRSNPALDAPKSAWDQAMLFFSPDERGYIANRAAHHYTVIEEEEGIISLIAYLPDDPSRTSGILLYRYGPEISRQYTLEGNALETRVAHIAEREKAI